MTHTKLDELMNQYLDGELNTRDMQRVEAFMEQDSHFQQKVYALEDLSYALLEAITRWEPSPHTQSQLQLIENFGRKHQT